MLKEGNIFNVQRFSTKDGPGIRTVVFFKGCPLDCAWCHNPESKSQNPQLIFDENACILCGVCSNVCPNGVHSLSNKHTLLRDNCKGCFACADMCPSGALEKCGKVETAEDIIETVLRDKPFFKQEGGVTFSGGEPLMQYDFLLTLLKKAKEENIHTAIETCGFTTRDLAPLCKYTDLWLYDVKLLSDELHKKWTGVSNEKILENLKTIDALGGKIILRCPIIPDVNLCEEYFLALSDLANELKNVVEINLEPYHPLGVSKSARLGVESKFNCKDFLSAERLSPFIELIENKTRIPIKII